MGLVINHAIVVTGTHGDYVDLAHARAQKIFLWVSPISPESNNGSRSFFIPPDGSKSEWRDSVAGDERREKFRAWLYAAAFADGSSPLSWVEIYYGDSTPAIVDDSRGYYRSVKKRLEP